MQTHETGLFAYKSGVSAIKRPVIITSILQRLVTSLDDYQGKGEAQNLPCLVLS